MKNSSFRYDIATLRALAVVAVVLYHFKFPFFHSGYIGVDIFFVISGFLMTKIILSKLDNDSFKLIDFYKQRLTRISPAMLAMLTIFGILLLIILPIKFINFSKYVIPSTLFYSNNYYYLNSSYFDISSQENFLLHTWSLSLEWQFYIIYPLLILLWKKYFKSEKSTLLFLSILSITSFGLMLYILKYNASLSFYIFPTRAWEMTLGGVAYLIGQKSMSKKISNILSVISFLVLILSITNFIPIGQYGWPSLLTIIPVIATFTIITCHPQANILKNRLTNFISDISYSWYLWHWPIYVLILYFIPDYNLFHKLIFIPITFLLAIGSYYLIEQRHIFLQPKLILVYASIFVFISFNISSIYQGDQLIKFYNEYKDKTVPEQFHINNGHLMHNIENHFVDTIKYHQKFEEGANYLLIGDSHTGMFSNYLIEEAAKKNINLIQISADATFPHPNSVSDYKKPQELMRWIFNTYIPANKNKIKKVLISANYSTYSREDLVTKIMENEKYFQKLNIPIHYIGQTPKYLIDYPIVEFLSRTYQIDKQKFIDAKASIINEFLKKQKINYYDLLTTNIVKTDKDNLYIYDKNHLSNFGAMQFAQVVMNKLR